MKHILHLSMLVVGLCCAGCGGPKVYRSAEGAVWNTTYHISYRASSDLHDSIRAVMKQVEMSLSPFAKGSLISRVNRGEDVCADSLLVRILGESRRVCALSGGAFDPTVSPLVNLWGFGYKPGDPEPSQEKVDSLLQLVGIGECSVSADGRVVKKHPQTEFNFSAITKGYGCDLVGEMLARNGATDYMVEIGGEIAMRGRNPKGHDWHIQIDAPVESDGAPVHEQLVVLPLTDCGVATSGNYRNYRETGEGRVWHTISPVTGRPAITDILSATVIAPSAMLADALATACMASPASEALDMVSAIPDVEALIVTPDTVLVTEGLGERLSWR
ncbi:MAG: FAD:protein FMN transferase [Duncaniella sp.]|nr:FAD:protein FMN transferase [Duncaniella sp.]